MPYVSFKTSGVHTTRVLAAAEARAPDATPSELYANHRDGLYLPNWMMCLSNSSSILISLSALAWPFAK